MRRIKEHPELLLDIIPGKHTAKNRLREKLRQNQEQNRKEFVHKYNLKNSRSPESSIQNYRPGTSGTNFQNESKENLDLSSNVDHYAPSSATHYSQKSNHSQKSQKIKSIIINHQMQNMTKEKILKLSDKELTKFMKEYSSCQNRDNLHWPPGQLSSPGGYYHGYKHDKGKVKSKAIKMASDLFSYYYMPSNRKAKNSSFSIRQPQDSFFKEWKRQPGIHSLLMDQTREVALEDTGTNIKIITDIKNPNKLHEPQNIDYISTFAIGTSKASRDFRGSLPTLPENVPNRATNKSMPRLNSGAYPVAASHYKQRKRRLDINKISSNLHKKD